MVAYRTGLKRTRATPWCGVAVASWSGAVQRGIAGGVVRGAGVVKALGGGVFRASSPFLGSFFSRRGGGSSLAGSCFSSRSALGAAAVCSLAGWSSAQRRPSFFLFFSPSLLPLSLSSVS
jgi:hypothetical protein